MATFGYLVYVVRANPPHRSKELYRMSSVGESGEDILDVAHDHLRALGPGYHREERESEGFRVKALDRQGRTLSVTINKGPEGATGETYDLDTQESRATTERQALLSGLRAMFVLPQDSYY